MIKFGWPKDFSLSTTLFDYPNIIKHNRSILFDNVPLSSIKNVFDYVRLPTPGVLCPSATLVLLAFEFWSAFLPVWNFNPRNLCVARD